MDDFLKPDIVVSRCLGFEACRYNGQVIRDTFIESFKPYVNCITVCPEYDIGLGVPRESLRVVLQEKDKAIKLYQPNTNMDFTEPMNRFCSNFLKGHTSVDGFILKSKSPSCGINGVNIYNGYKQSARAYKGHGLFGTMVMKEYPYLALEDEGRLTNYQIRDNFLIKIFINKNFREVKGSSSIEKLIKFHEKNTLLLMAYSQKRLKILNNIIALKASTSYESLIAEYEKNLRIAFSKMARHTNSINVLMFALESFSNYISKREKELILDSLEKFRLKKLPLSTPALLIKSYLVRFEKEGLLAQTFFKPYPEALITLYDSGLIRPH